MYKCTMADHFICYQCRKNAEKKAKNRRQKQDWILFDHIWKPIHLPYLLSSSHLYLTPPLLRKREIMHTIVSTHFTLLYYGWYINQTVDDQQGTVFTKEVTSNKCPDKCLCIILHTFHEVTHKFTPSVINHLKYPLLFPIN